APEGFVAEAGDCNDGDAQINVGAPERCNAIDDDCDDSVDEGETVGDVPTWYRDADDDGRGDADRSVDTCLAPEGFVAEAGDCNDGDAQVNVGAPERCNAIDDDCDDSVDEGETVGDVPTWYRDADDDGRGDVDTSVDTCLAPAGFVAEAGDCNDGDAQINVGAPERCNGIDDNCDDEVDNGVPNDGAGCVDPGPPALNNRIQRAQLTIRNGNNAGDDGALELELIGTGVTQRRALNNVAWDDHMRNTVDVYDVLINNALFSRGRLAGGQGRIHYDDSDAWAFACVQLSFNGINVYCREYPQEITLDRGATERHSFTLPNPLPNQSIQCTCYDRYLTHGPIIGATGSDRVRIWGRTDALRRVRLRLGVEQNNLQTVSYRYGDPAKDNTFEFDIYGLESDQTYFYQIEVDGQTTPGTFKTAPDEGQAGVYEFAVGSCAKTIPSRHPEQLIFGAIEARDPDMMFMLGDNVYFDSLTNGDAPDVGAMRSYYRDAIQRRGSWAEPHYPPLNVYDPFNPAVRPDTSDRSRWWGSFGRDARADLFSSTPILAVWDDHDFYSNNADAFYDDDRGRKPWTMNSIDMFRQYWPNPDGGQSIDNPDRMGIYFKQTWGDVDIFGLDTRFHRDDTRRHMLGRAQLDWIKRELSASTATFKFVLSGSIFGGPSDDDEKWPWFGAELNEFYSHIWNNGIGGVVLMSGDVHVSAILEHRNPNNRADPYIIYEVISSGLANYGPNSGNPSDYGSIIQMRYLPPFDYDRRRTNAFALVTTNSNLADPRLSVQFYDERGNTACSDCPFQIRRSQLGPR
ncbi:MAG: alkaline phosphatase D family protein, partial [Bradymonadia bacterium]